MPVLPVVITVIENDADASLKFMIQAREPGKAVSSYQLTHARPLDQLTPELVTDVVRSFKAGVRSVGTSSFSAEYFDHSGWDCDKSPTSKCMYTQEFHEECIFCGSPQERK